MFKVKYTKVGNIKECFEGVMSLEDLLKFDPVVKIVAYLLAKNETFFLIIGCGNENWEIFYKAA